MGSFLFVFVSLLDIFGMVFSQMNFDVNSMKLQAPIISSITPTFGSVEGGTYITLTGAYFTQNGLFTERQLFLGGQICTEISYYTTDNQLICVTPPCVQPDCLEDPNWQGSVSVSLDFYIQGVEGIKSASKTFTYYGAYTPQLFQISRYIRSSAFFSIEGRTSNYYIDDMTIKIANNTASLGDPGTLNPAQISSIWSYNTDVYYLPPSDMQAGFYNLSFSVQTDTNNMGSGFARTFPLQKYSNYADFWHRYLYDATWSGNVYSVNLQPVITSLSVHAGSLAGGTKLTVSCFHIFIMIIVNCFYI
jgi:hypothetical protein